MICDAGLHWLWACKYIVVKTRLKVLFEAKQKIILSCRKNEMETWLWAFQATEAEPVVLTILSGV